MPLNRRQLFAAAPTFLQTNNDGKPKNILLMIADDLGLHTGAYGDKTARTPNLDKLAERFHFARSCRGVLRRGAASALHRNDALVNWTDLAPTILDFAGVAGPKDYKLPGRRWLPLLEQTTAAGFDQSFFSHTFHEVTMYYPMVRTGRSDVEADAKSGSRMAQRDQGSLVDQRQLQAGLPALGRG